VGLAQEREDAAAGELFDRALVALGITLWKSSRIDTTRSGWPLSMIVCSSA